MKQEQQSKEVVVTISPGVLLIALVAIFAVSFFTYKAIGGGNAQADTSTNVTSEAVIVKEGKQYITILARGGYSPRSVSAKSGIPTVLIMKTENSYGCERSFRIAKLGVSQNLPANGETPIDLGTPAAGSKIYGTCSMGMYSVTLNFN